MTARPDPAKDVEIITGSGDVFADLGLTPGDVAERLQKEIDRLTARALAAEAALETMRGAWTRAKQAADKILVEVTGKAGRLMYDAPHDR